MNTTEKKMNPILLFIAFLFSFLVVVQVFQIQFENGEIAAINDKKLVKFDPNAVTVSDAFVLGAPSEASIAKGMELYTNSCASCHGADGKSGFMPTNPAPRNFTNVAEFKFGIAFGDLFSTITNGSPGTSMAPFGYLPESDRVALAHYISEFIPKDAVSSSAPKVVDPSSVKLDDEKMTIILNKLAK